MRSDAASRLKVIVTRPLEQAMPWVRALHDAGLHAQALPLLEIEPAQDAAPVEEAWHRLQGTALVMFVSANAVKHFFALRPADVQWPMSALAGSTGPGTSAALQQAGMPKACILEPGPGVSFDSESLWTRLRTRDWHDERVIIVRGEEGRDWLADQLRAAGARVEIVAAYRRVAPVLGSEAMQLLSAAVSQPADYCWFFTSAEALSHLRDLAPGVDWSRSHALVSHLRIAHAARQAGFGDVQLFDGRPESVIDAVMTTQTPGPTWL